MSFKEGKITNIEVQKPLVLGLLLVDFFLHA